MHTIEKIGGTSMSDYESVRDNIVFKPALADNLYQRVFVVSAYGGITDKLLESKKNGQPGVYKLFASSMQDDSWNDALSALKLDMYHINEDLFGSDSRALEEANRFIND
ncbi:MAG: aspartate kinase, partial [Reinekea sp.]|nr:aspartate kinase [Reinekea sp.]